MGKLGTAIQAGKTAVELGRNAQNLAGAASELRNADKGDLGRRAGRHAFNEGTQVGKTAGKAWLKTFETVPRLVCRALQFLFAIIALGFYGHRVQVNDEKNKGGGFSPEWIFAVAVAGISSTTAVLFVLATSLGSIPLVGSKFKMLKTYRAFAWDMALFVAWLVVFGLFAAIFLHRNGDDPKYKGASTGPMKVAVWVDLTNALLWLTSAVYGALKTFLGEKAETATEKMGQKLFRKKQGTPETKEADYAESV